MAGSSVKVGEEVVLLGRAERGGVPREPAFRPGTKTCRAENEVNDEVSIMDAIFIEYDSQVQQKDRNYSQSVELE